VITCEVAQAAAVALALGSLGGWLGRDGILALVAILGAIALVRDVQPGRVPEELTPASLFSGIAFILRHRLLLGLMSLDLFAVLLGGATALLPIYARDILGTGPWGLGLLRAAPAVAALFGPVPAVLIGGVGTLAVLAVWTYRFPELRRFSLA